VKKIIALMIILVSCNIFGNITNLDQKISIKVKDMKASELFETLADNNDLKFVWGKKTIALGNISIEAKNVQLRKFLDKFASENNVSWNISNENIIKFN
jgi:hypothetical protein